MKYPNCPLAKACQEKCQELPWHKLYKEKELSIVEIAQAVHDPDWKLWKQIMGGTPPCVKYQLLKIWLETHANQFLAQTQVNLYIDKSKRRGEV